MEDAFHPCSHSVLQFSRDTTVGTLVIPDEKSREPITASLCLEHCPRLRSQLTPSESCNRVKDRQELFFYCELLERMRRCCLLAVFALLAYGLQTPRLFNPSSLPTSSAKSALINPLSDAGTTMPGCAIYLRHPFFRFDGLTQLEANHGR